MCPPLPNNGGEHPSVSAACPHGAATEHRPQRTKVGTRCLRAAVPSPPAPKNGPEPKPNPSPLSPRLAQEDPRPRLFSVPPVAFGMGVPVTAPHVENPKQAVRPPPSNFWGRVRLREPPEDFRWGVWSPDHLPHPRPPRRSLEGPTRPIEPQTLDPPPPLRARVPRVAPLEPPRDPRPPRRPGAMASWPKRVRQSSWPNLGGRKSAWNKAARS